MQEIQAINKWDFDFDTSADAPAQRFLAALRKNGDSRIRGFLHKQNPGKGSDKANKKAIVNKTVIERWQAMGRGIYVVIGNGGDSDAEITDLPAFFAEWDDLPVEDQLNYDWRNFLEPSMSVITLKSVHEYWILDKNISDIARWRNLQIRMIAVLKSDSTVQNPSQLMRLPGCYYADANGELVKPIELHSLTEKRYTVDDIEAAIIREEQRLDIKPSTTGTAPSAAGSKKNKFAALLHDGVKRADARPKEQILSALKMFPPRIPGSGTYRGDEPIENLKGRPVHIDYFKVAVGCWKAFEYVGVSFDEAIEHMQKQHPLWSDLREQIANSGGVGPNGKPIEDSSFWDAAHKQFDWVAPDKAPAEDDLLTDCQVMAETLKKNRETASEEFELMSVLPRNLALNLAARAATFPVHESAMFSPFCAAIATSVGWRFKVQPKKGHTEPLCFWFANVQQLSEMKSPVGKEVTYESLDNLHDIDLKRYASEREIWETRIAMSELSKKSLKSLSYLEAHKPDEYKTILEKAEDCKHNRNTQIRIKAFFKDPACPLAPPRTTVTKDSTLEQLAALMAQPNNTGLLLYFDELARFMEMMDQYRTSGGDRQAYLDLWSGSSIDVQRKESGRTYAKRTNLNMFGYIQPETLRSILGDEKLSAIHGGDGFWARWLFCTPPHVMGLYNDLEGSVAELMQDTLMKIDNKLQGSETELLTFTPEAFALYRDTVNEWMLSALDAPLGIQGMVSKLKGYTARFAGLLHIVEWAASDSEGRPSPTISVETMRRAIQVCSYFRKQYEMVMTKAGTTGIPEWVSRLELMVDKHKVEEVTTSQMTRWRVADDQTDANKKIEALVDDLCLGNRRKNRQNNWVWIPNATNPNIDDVMG